MDAQAHQKANKNILAKRSIFAGFFEKA